MADVERKTWEGEAARSRAMYARHQAEELVDDARKLVWSWARECGFARRLLSEAAQLRRSGEPDR